MELKSNTDYSNQAFGSVIQLGHVFKGIEFSGCSFNMCDFSDCTFNDCTFEECIFQSSNLSNCKLDNSRIVDSKFNRSKMIGIDWAKLNTQLGLKLECEGCDLSYGVFLRIDITGSVFLKCKMNELDLSETIAKESILKECDFLRTIFYKTNLKGADMTGSYNYVFDPAANMCKGLKLSSDQAANLLIPYGIEVVNQD